MYASRPNSRNCFETSKNCPQLDLFLLFFISSNQYCVVMWWVSKKAVSSTNKRNSNVFGSISQALARDLFSTTRKYVYLINYYFATNSIWNLDPHTHTHTPHSYSTRARNETLNKLAFFFFEFSDATTIQQCISVRRPNDKKKKNVNRNVDSIISAKWFFVIFCLFAQLSK